MNTGDGRALRPARRNFNQIHSQSLPVQVRALPAFIPHNPISILRLLYTILFDCLRPSSYKTPQYHAYYSASTQSVVVTDPIASRMLWEQGFFGKGSLSRSEPEWLERERQRIMLSGDHAPSKHLATAGDVTERRRQERREEKRERARKEQTELEEQLKREGKFLATQAPEEKECQAMQETDNIEAGSSFQNGSVQKHTAQHSQVSSSLLPTALPTAKVLFQNEEHLQLTPQEVMFLTYGLGCLKVFELPYSTLESKSSHAGQKFNNEELLWLLATQSSFFPQPNPYSAPGAVLDIQALAPDSKFLLHYVVYHHFRSLGWVVRPGIKFAVDWLLYARGPAFAHAEFAVLVLPSYQHADWARMDSSQRPRFKRQWGAVAAAGMPWWLLHSTNRVQNQVKKNLVLVYVEIPSPLKWYESLIDERASGNGHADIGRMLRSYHVREFVIKRWTPNRNRG